MIRRWKILGAALLLAPAIGVAQMASLDVAVENSAGGAAAGVRVELQNKDSGYAAGAATNAQGRARFTAVPAGPGYSLLVESRTLAGGLQLRANEARALTLTLPLEAIVVTADRQSARTNSIDAEVSAGFSSDQLRAMPVEARDLNRALARLPNVVPSTGFFPEAPSVSINGANGLYAQYLIDGMDNNENFLGGPKFPIPTGFVQDVTVLAASYSAQYGRAGNGVVNVTTKSGGNSWKGEAFYLSRPGPSVDASTPFAGRDLSGNAVKSGFRRDQGGFAFGGPIIRDRTFIFLDVEISRDLKDNLLSSPSLGVNDSVRGVNRSLLVSAKIDHKIDEDWRFSWRVNRGAMRIERQGGGLDGGVIFPSAGSVQDRVSTLSSMSLLYERDAFSWESTFGYSRFRWNYGRPLGVSGPQVRLNGPDGLAIAILGDPGYVFDEVENSRQFQQGISLTRGPHVFKIGLDVLDSHFTLAGGGNADGNYTVQLSEAQIASIRSLNRGAALNIGDVPAGVAVQDYAVELRPADFGRSQTQTGVYLEDRISLSSRLTATIGARWDYDSLSKAGAAAGDGNNIGPRLALHFRINPAMAWHAGAGRFYERIPYTVASDALQQNTTSGPFQEQLRQLIDKGILPAGTVIDRITADGNLSVSPGCTQYLNCPTPANSQALRETAFSNERRIFNPGGLDNPYTDQFSMGLEWEFSTGIVARADIMVAEGHQLLRLRDLNAPAPFAPNLANLTDANIALLRSLASNAERQALAESLGLIRSQAAADATRPVAVLPGGARQIIISESQGRSRYRALTLRLDKSERGESFGYALAYTLSKLSNDTDDINFRSANSNQFASEWGPSVNDRRHVLSAVMFFRPSANLMASLTGLIQSGQPINYIPDAGIYGTTDLNGDGASFSDAYLGNSDRAPGASRNSGRLPWSKTVDAGLRYTSSAGSGKLEISADIFNVLNQTNLSGFANAANQSNQIQIGGQPFISRNGSSPRQFQFGLRYVFE